MLNSVGFFHFGNHHERPLESLDEQMSSSGVKETLVVLPEAFNLGRPYAEGGDPKIPQNDILAGLSVIAKHAKSAFVVGLLEAPPFGAEPYSSAYFVDVESARLMCHKAEIDRIGRYAPCLDNPDLDNPVVLPNISVISVICKDVQDSPRLRVLACHAKAAEKPHALICVPAAMSDNYWFGGAPSESHQSLIEQCFGVGGRANLIVANADPRGVGSFITSATGVVQKRVGQAERRGNVVKIMLLVE
jgi:hypothetical protein